MKKLLGSLVALVRYIKKSVRWLVNVAAASGAVTSVAVSTAVGVGAVAGVWWTVDKVLDGVNDLTSRMGDIGAGISVDGSFLSKVNYVLPLDTLASCVTVWVGVWVAVQTAKWWRAMLTAAQSTVQAVKK